MDIGELVISLRLRTDALERGLTETQRRLREQDRAAREAAAGQRELQSAYTKTAAVAAVAFTAIVAAIMSGVKAHNEYRSAIVGLKSVADGTGNDMATLQAAVDGLTKDGLIPATAAATGLKNLLSRGFSDIEAVEILTRFKDAAAFGRQASLSLGDAVRSATEGIKNENSILVDNAGVTKNVSVMWKEYAESIDVGVDSLTMAQKRQAEYNGIMNETRFQVGDAAKYSAEFAGQQAALVAQTGLLSEAFGASMIPLLSTFASILQPIVLGLTEWTKRNPELVSTTTALIAALTAMIAVVGGVKAGMIAWTFASTALGTALKSLMLNPVILALTALAGVIAFVIYKKQEATAETKRLKEAEEEYQKVVENGITKDQASMYEGKITKLKELTAEHEKTTEAIKAFQAETERISSGEVEMESGRNRSNEIFELADALKAVEKEFKKVGSSADTAAEEIKTYTKAVKDANRATAAEVNESAKNIAMKNREVLTVQALLKQYSTAEKGTSEWSAAQKQLSDMFPQFSTAVGINEEAIRGLLVVKQQEVAVAWASMQIKAQEILLERKRELAVREAAIAVVDAGTKWLFGMDLAAGATRVAREEVEKLKGEIVSLQAFATMEPSKVAGVLVLDESKFKVPPAAKAYQNKALDNAYRLMEHRKRMNELTLQDELKTLEQIESRNIKTADERMEIEERIYDVTQQIGDKTLEQALKRFDRAKDRGLLNENEEIYRLNRIKKLYADDADERMQLDDMIFDASQRKKEGRKSLDADILTETNRLFKEAAEDRLLREDLTAEQRFEIQRKTYAQTIAENKAYLQKVLADDKYTATEKETIQRQITSDIRENVNERLRLEKEYYAQIKQENINGINDLSKGIQSALREKYGAEKTAEEDRIKGLLDANEVWKKSATDNAKSTYDARLKAAQAFADAEIALIDKVYGAQIKAIQDELAALDQAEKQKSRAELDLDDATKISKLQSKIDFEHDDFNKVALQKELNKVLADQAKRHEGEQLADKKEALKATEQTLKEKLKEETELLKQQLSDKKELLAAERDTEIERINANAEAMKAAFNQALINNQVHYAKLLSAKAIQAEAEKLIVDKNQKEIIKLLDGFGEAYQITGQTLGEKLYEGFKDKVMQIVPMIDNINRQIDAARNAAVAALNTATTNKATPATSASTSTTTGKTVTVNNTFNTPVTSPSDISKATQKTAQKLL